MVLGCEKTPSGSLDAAEAGTAKRVQSEAELAAGAPRLKLTMVDVGQGDGFLLELPSGARVAVDGGPDRYGSYKDLLDGMSRIDYILLSHAHSDHYTGLGNAIALLPDDCDGRVYDPGLERPGITGYEYFRSASGCRYRSAGNGMSLAFDPQVDITVAGVADAPYPSDDGWGINNTSMITYLRFGRFAALFTGDAQTDAEKRVVAAYATLRANVMKVGHHGSCNATGTTFLRSVAPEVALISAAQGNDFGHPHCQTLKKLAGQGSHWYRTDRNGTVTIITDGESYTVVASRGQQDDPVCPRSCADASDF
jgi:competence protein ComEC